MAWTALWLHVVFLALERLFLKELGQRFSSLVTSTLFFATGALFLLPLAYLADRPHPSEWIHALPAALIYAFAFYCYVAAVGRGQLSLVAPLSHLNVLFIFFWPSCWGPNRSPQPAGPAPA